MLALVARGHKVTADDRSRRTVWTCVRGLCHHRLLGLEGVRPIPSIAKCWNCGAAWTVADGQTRFQCSQCGQVNEQTAGAPAGGFASGPVVAVGGTGMAVAALCCGIVGVVIGLIPLMFLVAGLLGVLSIIFGIVALGRPVARGMAWGGLICGIVALLLAGYGAFVVLTAADELQDALTGINQSVDEEDSATSATAPEAGFTVSQQNAIEAAESYLDTGAFSEEGLVDQLSSKYGEGFPKADAVFAVKHIKVNWKEQAAESAKGYLDTGSFSCQGLIDQLESKYGENFTHSQAVYGARQTGLC